MSSSLFSQSWYRVGRIRARLRQHVAIHRHRYRGRVWYVMQDRLTGQFHRFSPEAYQIIGLMDGQRTLQEVWQLACRRLGDAMPTQEDIIQLVAKLNRANVLQSDIPPDFEDLSKRQRDVKKRKLLQQLKSPLGVRIPLLDPERFLNATYPWVRPLLGIGGVVLWLVVVGYGLLLASLHWEDLTLNVQDRLLALENLLLMALIYPLVKGIHELGHAYAVKRWGGEVHEMGVMLLVFVPVPYVDATAASAFRDKYRRMVVGAAGILVEVFLAAVAMVVWAYAEPGVARAFAFNVMVISGVSTLLFNGNPLLRFDAYYVLSDALEIPNLATRGNQYLGYLIKRYLYGVREVTSPANTLGEGLWMGGYAIAAFCYRLFIMVAISLFVASKYFLVGALFAVWAIYGSVVSPLFKTLSKPMTDPQLQAKKRHTLMIAGTIATLLILLLFVIPFPLTTQVEGVVWVPEHVYVRSEQHGFIERVAVTSGSRVARGDLLLKLSQPGLDAQVLVSTARLKEAQARYQAAQGDRVEVELVREEVDFLQQELAHYLERQRGLSIRSERDGVFIIPDAGELPGRYLTRGNHVGYLVDFGDLPIAAVVGADHIDLVRYHTRGVELRFASQQETTYPGRVRRIMPSTTRDLPSRVLSVDGGGHIALNTNDAGGVEAVRDYFLIEIELDGSPGRRLEERVYVLFRHEPEPLFLRLYRAVRRVFLRQFDV